MTVDFHPKQRMIMGKQPNSLEQFDQQSIKGAKNMLKKGFTPVVISCITGIPETLLVKLSLDVSEP